MDWHCNRQQGNWYKKWSRPLLCHESRVEIKKVTEGKPWKTWYKSQNENVKLKGFHTKCNRFHPGKITKSLSTVCPLGKTWQLWRHVTLKMLWLLFKNKISAEWINLDWSDELVSFTSDLPAIHIHWSWDWLNNWNCYLYLACTVIFIYEILFFKLRRAFFDRSVP